MDNAKTELKEALENELAAGKPTTNSSTTEHSSLKDAAKAVPTKVMMQETIKDFSTKFRKGFSLDKIRKYILQNYLHTAKDFRYRLPLIRKIFKNALEKGEILSVKGAGLTGSFRVPATSPLHKNSKQNLKNIDQKQSEEDLKKQQQKHKVALAKRRQVRVKKRFSAYL